MAKLCVLSEGGGADIPLGDIHLWRGLGVVSTDIMCSMCAGVQQPPATLEHLGPQSPHRERTMETGLPLLCLNRTAAFGGSAPSREVSIQPNQIIES